MVSAEPGLATPLRRAAARLPGTRRGRRFLVVAAAALVLASGAYLTFFITHPLRDFADWYDLSVYYRAGLIARNSPARLYSWQLRPGIQFTYTPFAAVLFAAGSLLPWAAARWLTTAASMIALAMTVWLTLGALGWRRRPRVAGLLALVAVAIWLEPVQRALHLGQVELLLMYLIAWDMCQDDRRWWKGAGAGLAAGIKLVPLIFIPYLVLSGRPRQAAAAAAAFAVTIAAGFALLPGESVTWWLTGYFLRVGKAGDPASLLNQSLPAMMARAGAGPRHVQALWLGTDIVIAIAGLGAAATAHRSGRPVAGWLTCALTGLLVSPVSWDHHWVWVVPGLALAADAAARSRGAARAACLALAAVAAGIFGAWPRHLTGADGLVPRGLLGALSAAHGPHREFHLRGAGVITWNLYLAAGVALLAVALAAAIRSRGRRRARRP